MEDKVATKVYDTFELELENGESVLIKPLPIKALRRFMDVINNENVEDETDMMDVFMEACVLCLKALHPKVFSDKTKEDIEELVTLPTVMKILEVAGGLKASDPNLLGAALVGTN
jgi:hypothetical protein